MKTQTSDCDMEQNLSCNDTEYTEESDRDEVLEVRKVSQKDTFNVRLWRFVVTGALLLTAVAVTLTTYKFLQREQYNDFETAFEQFSRTVGDAAVEHQKHIRDAYRGLATTISAYAASTNATWPFFTLPNFENYAQDTLRQSKTEVLGVDYLITSNDREKWIEYANVNYENMIREAHLVKHGHLNDLTPSGYHPYISGATAEGLVPDKERDYYAVVWNYSPPPFSYGILNWNIRSIPDYDMISQALLELKNETLATKVRHYVSVGIALSQEEHDKMHSELPESQSEHPHSFLFHPIHEVVGDYNSPIVAFVGCGMAWDASLLNLLPDGVTGIHTVIENTCNQSYTYEINGKDAIFLGEGDNHESKYDDMEVVVDLAVHTHPNFTTTPGHCQYSMHIYPSSKFEESYDSFTPELFAAVVSTTFVVVAIVFFTYDMFVQRRNEKLVENAARSNAIVSSLFPSNIRDRLVKQTQDGINASKRINNLKSFLAGNMTGEGGVGGNNNAKPLADLFLDTTIMFADICGFTAWSSVREPSQVFTLLETVYQSFDQIAKRRRVFKVETVGDCYVAATGIPDPHKNHAIIMVKFARLILDRMHILVKELEITLGPDTGDLSIRVGLHSGPVTAGVLRGERARFQLFGDTVNTAARIEATGSAGRIHVSQETADRIVNCGKGHWLEKRHETVQAKGKGDMQTYFVASGFDHAERCSVVSQESQPGVMSGKKKGSSIYDDRIKESGLDESALRLVDWNVEMLLGILKQIVARRTAKQQHQEQQRRVNKQLKDRISLSVILPMDRTGNLDSTSNPANMKTFESSPFDEIQQIIHLPEFDSKIADEQKDPEHVEISETIVSQLRDYVTLVASMYRDNAFHNFEHASHVTMSVIKLLSRIVAPTDLDVVEEHHQHQAKDAICNEWEKTTAATLHDHTYGITSDPLTQFACAFSALIHDADHCGVPNAQLIKEGSNLAVVYKNRSVAEQNSLVLAWDLLMLERFDEFRSCLCVDDRELLRFRQLVVNSVMATDIVDKDLKNLRNARWDVAFKQQQQHEDKVSVVNRKATIVIEHLIQASDVAHTMQHWHVYRKWNERFFRECYAAYKAGRAEKDPSENWYMGELGFFDFYIIPLAKKLKDCGVFGKSSDEYLTYAESNRKEWEARGQAMVCEMMESILCEGQCVERKDEEDATLGTITESRLYEEEEGNKE